MLLLMLLTQLPSAYVSEQLGLPGNSYDSIRVLSERIYLENSCWIIGLMLQKECQCYSKSGPLTLTENLNFPVIVKPTDSSGSKGVSSDIRETTCQAVEYASLFSRNKRIIIEEFIVGSGKQLHGDGFVFDGNLVLPIWVITIMILR